MDIKWLKGPNRSLTRFGEIPRFKEGLYQPGKFTYSWMVPNGSWGETNLGLIDCKGQSVLIDTAWDLKFTKEWLDAAQGILKQSPVEYLINTHSDGDHFWGNQLFKDKKIIATHACAKRMPHLRPSSVNALLTVMRPLQWVPVFGLHTLEHYMRNMFLPYDFKDISLTPANEPFSGEKHLSVNGVEIVIEEIGTSHTDGDAMVYLPQEKILFSGDIVFFTCTPVLWAGPIENCLAGLKKIIEKDVDIIIPGHGPFATKKDVQCVIDYWEMVRDALFVSYHKGMPPMKAAQAFIASEKFLASPFVSWDSPERIVASAHTQYRHWGAYKTVLPEVIDTMRIFKKQARLTFEMPEAKPSVMRHFH